MAQLDIAREYEQGEILLEADLDAIQSALTSLFNTTKLDDDNFQANSINADDKIIDNTVTTAILGTDSITETKINDLAVTTAKILDANVTTAKINTSAVTTAKIADANVTTAKIADANVTGAKLSNATTSSSGVSQSENTTSAPGAHIATSLSISVTTTGRPLLVALNPTATVLGDSSVIDTNAHHNGTTGTVLPAAQKDMVVVLYRDASIIEEWYFSKLHTELGPLVGSFGTTLDYGMGYPPGTFWFVDEVAAGTYTYSIKINYAGVLPLAGTWASSTMSITNTQLIAVEI